MIIVGPLSQVQNLVDQHGVSHVVTLLAPARRMTRRRASIPPAISSSISTTLSERWTAMSRPARAMPRS